MPASAIAPAAAIITRLLPRASNSQKPVSIVPTMLPTIPAA
jgi:hypothetical protein